MKTNISDIAPLVSVYVTTKDRPYYLSRALQSICNQTYKNIEVLICNDGSKDVFLDEYNQIIKDFQSKFIALTYLYNESSVGACVSRNKLINLAKGKFVTGLDDDDCFFPNRIELFLKYYDGSYAFLCARGSSDINEDYQKIISGGEPITFEQMKNSNLVGNQIFVEKERMLQISGFDENMPAWQDYDTWFRLLQKYEKCYKLNARTMYLDTDPQRERISTTSKAYLGYKTFINKHQRYLSDYNLLSLKYNDLINRKERFSLLNIELIKHPNLLKRIFKERAVYYYPAVYSFYRKVIS